MAFMDFFKPALNVAAALIPGVGPIVAGINAFLPEDKKLPETATGQQVIDAYESLPPESRVRIDEIAASVTIAQEEGWTDRYKAMTAADGQSTRPRIAVMMAQVLSFEIMAFTVWCFLYPEQMKNDALWMIFGTLTGVPAGLLGKYFGELRKEQSNRLEVKPAPLLSSIKKMFGG